MKQKKVDKYKVSWGGWKEVWEILVHIVLTICVIYAVYSFFHNRGMESGDTEKAKIEKIEKEGKGSGGYRIKLDIAKPKVLEQDAAAEVS
jgi:hypothetical protein